MWNISQDSRFADPQDVLDWIKAYLEPKIAVLELGITTRKTARCSLSYRKADTEGTEAAKKLLCFRSNVKSFAAAWDEI